MALDDPPASLVGSVCVIVHRDVVSDPDRWEQIVLELEDAARASLAKLLGRPADPGRISIGVLYGCRTPEGAFQPFPCPEATHARVSVRLVEE